MRGHPLCAGPDPRRAMAYKNDSKAAHILSVFYTLAKKDQLVFMAMFDQMIENNRNKDNE